MTVQTDQTRRVLFFTANAIATDAELDLISQIPGKVEIRNVRAGQHTYPEPGIAGVAAGAGVTIPTMYADTEDYPRLTPTGAGNVPAELYLSGGDNSIDLSNAETAQLVLVGTMPGSSDEVDLHASGKVTYVSSDPTKATVSTTGLVTPVAPGSTNITATYTEGSNTRNSNVVAMTVVA